jgi:hypothetical protein
VSHQHCATIFFVSLDTTCINFNQFKHQQRSKSATSTTNLKTNRRSTPSQVGGQRDLRFFFCLLADLLAVVAKKKVSELTNTVQQTDAYKASRATEMAQVSLLFGVWWSALICEIAAHVGAERQAV